MARQQGVDDAVMAHPLSYVRQERNWTYQDLVDVVARRVGNSAARREKAWRWENWGVVPDNETQMALADELGVARELVRSLGWPRWLPAGEGINAEAPWTTASTVSLLDTTTGAALVDRRGFLILGAGVAMSIADTWLTTDPPQILAVLKGGRIDIDLVTCLEERLPTLRRMDAALGGGSVRNVVDAELRLVTDLLTKGSYTEVVGQRMFSVAAELGRVAGWASFDAGYHAAAERYWTTALRSAHTASDRGLGANILKSMCLQRVDTDRPGEALALAQAALTGAKDASARVRAMLTVRQARTHAVLGERAACERLLTRAERLVERAADESSPAWAAYFDEAEYCAQVAACYMLLRQHAATSRWLEQSLSLQPGERSRDRATYLMWHAEVMVRNGEIDEACDLVARAAPDIFAAQSVRNEQRLADIRGLLRKHRTPAVDALDERMRAFVA